MSRGHIRKRGGKWQITVELPKSPTGRRRQRSFSVSGSKKDAEAKLTDELAAIDGNKQIDRSNKQTLGQYATAWLERMAVRLSPTTVSGYRMIIDKHLCRSAREKCAQAGGSFALGDVRLVALTFEHVESYYAEYRTRGLLSETSLRHHHALLRTVLKDAVKRKVIDFNPMDVVEAPSVQKSDIKAFEAGRNRALIDLFNDQYQVMVSLSLATGMRRSEVCGLMWDCVVDGIIDVRRALVQADREVTLKAPKTKGSRRRITIPSSVARLLDQHRANQAEQRLRTADVYDNRGFVFASEDGTPIRPVAYTKRFRALVMGGPFDGVSLHSLRHAHASQLIEANVNIKTISSRLGHSNIGITLDTYGHLLPGMDEAAARAVDGSF